MAELLIISPVKLYQQSFLGGTILLIALITLLLDLVVVGLRAFFFNRLSFSVLAAVMWYIMLLFLLLDLVATLLLPSRALQEGAVMAFSIISLMQVPIVTLYLEFELSSSMQVWLINACSATSTRVSCASWFASVRIVAISTGTITVFLHLFLCALCAYYVRTRPATAQDLIMTHRHPKRSRRSKKDPKSKKVKAPKPSATPPAPARPYDPYLPSASDEDQGVPPPSYPPSLVSGGPVPPPTDPLLLEARRRQPQANAVHTDSDSETGLSDLEKQPLSTEPKSLGRRRRRRQTSGYGYNSSGGGRM
ncbi:hypothetical protein JCM5296_006533 [Sporobolomyces johnsonii]